MLKGFCRNTHASSSVQPDPSAGDLNFPFRDFHRLLRERALHVWLSLFGVLLPGICPINAAYSLLD